MLTHIGLLTLTETATAADRSRIIEGLEEMVGVVDGLLGVRTGLGLGLVPGNADVVFELTFASQEAWEAYAGHPAHKALIAERIAPVLAAKSFAQVAELSAAAGTAGAGTEAADTETADTEAADEDYTAAGFQGSLEIRGAVALVVVDPAQAYTDPECSLYAGVEEPVEVMRQVLAQAREAGIPVFVTRVEHDPSGRTGGVFVRKVPALANFTPDSPFSRYIEGLEPSGDDIEIVKQYPSAFASTHLAATLRSLGIDNLLITGLSTSGCIRATATDAMQLGFVPIVVGDAVGDRLDGPHEANLFDIRAKIGEVVNAAEVPQILAAAGGRARD